MFPRTCRLLARLLPVIGVFVAIQSAAEAQPIAVSNRGDSLPRLASEFHPENGQPWLVEGKRASSDDVSIVEARWGAFDGWVNVTKQLRDKVKNGWLFIPDLNAILADVEDPKSGADKSLVVVYEYRGKTRLVIVASTAPTGRGGALRLPEEATLIEQDPQAFHKTLAGTKWRMATNGLTIFFEDGKYGVSDWGDRRGIWMVTGPNQIGGVAYEGSHNDVAFDRSLTTGMLVVNGLTYSKLTRLPDADATPVIKPLDDRLTGTLFESVLGVYGQAIRGKRHPFVNLRPPNRDLWTKDIEATLQGTLSYAEVDYIGTANLVIPESGTYTIDIPESGTQLRLNDQLVKAGDVELSPGVYKVKIYTNHWGQPYLKYAHAMIFKQGTKTRIPFVNTGDALEEFFSQKINGRTVTEVRKYQTKRIKVTPGSDD